MYTNVAYVDAYQEEIIDVSVPLAVTSCGYYQLDTQPLFTTERPTGRKDYQLLYIASGRAHFYFENKEHIITKGNMVLYRPDEPQLYFYYGREMPEIYWVHFTGCDVDKLLDDYEIPRNGNTFFAGISPDYQWLYRQMIQELQMRRMNYKEILPLLLGHIFLMASRQLKEGSKVGVDVLNEIERAAHFFQENYNQQINVEEYARAHNMSACWFNRSFKKIVKATPMQYILLIRMINAKTLLENTSCNISEVASAVGYDNALYFSRLFHKHVGCSPSEYRKRLKSDSNRKQIPTRNS